mmetsp:Transcript_38344/g.32410  ORF Transcript_38344/g.32410 Transcript_38344/m.32410 type:complete len:115 (+) Transcript_38344:199-543(+)
MVHTRHTRMASVGHHAHTTRVHRAWIQCMRMTWMALGAWTASGGPRMPMPQGPITGLDQSQLDQSLRFTYHCAPKLQVDRHLALTCSHHQAGTARPQVITRSQVTWPLGPSNYP